ncbi:hypothetical protein KQX54_003578 [Cotesia glomerata]|uniref:Uncharacterized protein n=1 Tax=Cotesia glomerata TaxID=32391 RepID=A0AAV7IG49_COTGL|nr:hypothetical protein KQX54_003578 [Cotesia glomerata]
MRLIVVTASAARRSHAPADFPINTLSKSRKLQLAATWYPGTVEELNHNDERLKSEDDFHFELSQQYHSPENCIRITYFDIECNPVANRWDNSFSYRS